MPLLHSDTKKPIPFMAFPRNVHYLNCSDPQWLPGNASGCRVFSRISIGLKLT